MAMREPCGIGRILLLEVLHVRSGHCDGSDTVGGLKYTHETEEHPYVRVLDYLSEDGLLSTTDARTGVKREREI